MEDIYDENGRITVECMRPKCHAKIKIREYEKDSFDKENPLLCAECWQQIYNRRDTHIQIFCNRNNIDRNKGHYGCYSQLNVDFDTSEELKELIIKYFLEGLSSSRPTIAEMSEIISKDKNMIEAMKPKPIEKPKGFWAKIFNCKG